MLYIYLMLFIAVFILLQYSKRCSVPEFVMVSKLLLPFAPMAALSYEKIKKLKNADALRRVMFSVSVNENLHRLNPALTAETLQAKYYIEKLVFVYALAFAACLFALLMSLSTQFNNELGEDNRLARNSYGQGDKQKALSLLNGDGEVLAEELIVGISERHYEKAEADALALELGQKLPELILGGNVSLQEVRDNLLLKSKYEAYPFEITWETPNFRLIDEKGSLGDKQPEKEGEIVTLSATLTYLDWVWLEPVNIRIFPQIKTAEEEFLDLVKADLIETDEREAVTEYLTLPDKKEGVLLMWEEIKENNANVLFVILVIAGIVVYYSKDNDLKKQADARRQSLLYDYPEIVSKLSLLMGAGMTASMAFSKLSYDYRVKLEKGYPKRFVYEEIALMCNEQASGLSETLSYDNLAKRCNLQRYYKFCAVLTQNLRKGSSQILPLLKSESKDAFEERKAIAKRLGEEAGTKLLIPMMMMLAVVVVIMIVPAVMSFHI